MGKEVKIGLAVIGVLLCVFGGVLFFRLRREAPGTAQKTVAAARKEGKTKADKKQPAKSEKQDDDRPNRPAGKTSWGASRHADKEAEIGDLDSKRAPDLDASPYRDRASSLRRGRYDEVPAANPLNEPGNEENTQEGAAGEETGQLSELSMPDNRFARRRSDGAVAEENFSQSAFSEEDDSDEDRAEPGEAAAGEGLAPAGEPQHEQLATDQGIHRPARGERMIGSELEPSEPPEAEREPVQLSPLVEDESEVRPAANDRYARQRYQQERSEGDRLDRGEFDRDQFDRGQFDRDRAEAPQDQEMADDAESSAGERVDESPVQRRPETGSYVVEPNDNFWRVSQKAYGTGAYFKALEEHNRRQQGEKRLINVGDVLSVPPLAVLRERYPDLCPKPRNAPVSRETMLTSSSVRRPRGSRTYTVAEGDTLFDIARHELGKASRWAEIYQLNREQLGEDFNYLSPGMQLALPEQDKQSAPIASRPRRDGYQR